MARKPILGAGGIVVRKGARPLIAIVQRAKDDKWVLPRGKLKRNEKPVRAAEREVVEETGHRVRLEGFAGAMIYRAQGRPKVVQFWHMKAAAAPSHALMKDISAVAWLPLKKAVRRLSYPLEQTFLESLSTMPGEGQALIKTRRRKQKSKAKAKDKGKTRKRSVGKASRKKKR